MSRSFSSKLNRITEGNNYELSNIEFNNANGMKTKRITAKNNVTAKNNLITQRVRPKPRGRAVRKNVLKEEPKLANVPNALPVKKTYTRPKPRGRAIRKNTQKFISTMNGITELQLPPKNPEINRSPNFSIVKPSSKLPPKPPLPNHLKKKYTKQISKFPSLIYRLFLLKRVKKRKQNAGEIIPNMNDIINTFNNVKGIPNLNIQYPTPRMNMTDFNIGDVVVVKLPNSKLNLEAFGTIKSIQINNNNDKQNIIEVECSVKITRNLINMIGKLIFTIMPLFSLYENNMMEYFHDQNIQTIKYIGIDNIFNNIKKTDITPDLLKQSQSEPALELVISENKSPNKIGTTI
jgi:hypothetical protein